MYIHEFNDWPKFYWDQEKIVHELLQVRLSQGRLIGSMNAIGFSFREDMIVDTITQDVVKTSEIEGEILDPSLVRSSVAIHLGIETAAVSRTDRNVDGIVEMILDATQNFDKPITKERLYRWHTILFPKPWNSFKKIKVGGWRSRPVHVVSGLPGKEIIHFEGPADKLVNQEMETFLDWLNHETSLDLILKSAVAHLWFVTIHPFDDGNGRIGRAIADLLLARSEKSARRFYSLSAQIQAQRKEYYHILEQTQKGTYGLDITRWIEWFLQCLDKAIQQASEIFEKIKHKERVWESFAKFSFNARQKKLINRLLDGFFGKLTTSKWAKISKCSQDTAHRDIIDLVRNGILIKNEEGGRSTSYSLRTCLKSQFLSIFGFF